MTYNSSITFIPNEHYYPPKVENYNPLTTRLIHQLTRTLEVLGDKRPLFGGNEYEYRVGTVKHVSGEQYTIGQYKEGKLIKEWDSLNQIEGELSFPSKAIKLCCDGFTKTSKGFTWKYENFKG